MNLLDVRRQKLQEIKHRVGNMPSQVAHELQQSSMDFPDLPSPRHSWSLPTVPNVHTTLGAGYIPFPSERYSSCRQTLFREEGQKITVEEIVKGVFQSTKISLDKPIRVRHRLRPGSVDADNIVLHASEVGKHAYAQKEDPAKKLPPLAGGIQHRESGV